MLSKLLHRWSPDSRVFSVAYLALLPFFLAPLCVTRFLPGLDLPFHLSMADMLGKAGNPHSPYAPYYLSTLGLKPYSAHYLALILLGKVTTVLRAHTLLVGVYVAGLPLAVGTLLAAAGRSRLPALLAFPLAYNLTLHYGFVSFSFSLPLVFLLCTASARFMGAERMRWSSWAWLAAIAWLLFLSHLQNFLFGLAAALTFIVCARGAPWARRGWALLALVPAAASLVAWQVRSRYTDDPAEQHKTLAFAWDQLKVHRLSDLGARSWWQDLAERLQALPAHTLRGFVDEVDVTACRVLFALIALYAVVGLGTLLLRLEPDEPRPRHGGALVVVWLGAAAAYLGLPHHLQSFELMTFYPRFSALIALTALPLVPSGLRRVRGWARWCLPMPAMIFGALYGLQLTHHYRLYHDEVADFAAVLDQARPGHKAIGLVFDRRSHVMRIESAFLGLPNFYAAASAAPGNFVPLWYCGMRHMPCQAMAGTPAGPVLPAPGPWVPGEFMPATAVPFFDYIFVRAPPPGLNLFGAQANRVALVDHVGTWWLYRRRP